MPADTYAQLLEEALQAEILANEACTDWLHQFVARIVDRSKPPFTL
jgi:hypothetical protein